MESLKPYKAIVPSYPSRNGDLLMEYFKDLSSLPRRVDATPVNRLLLLPQVAVARDFNLLAAVLSPGEGKYVPRPNIYLLPKGSSRFTELHEEAHGLFAALNPYAKEMSFTRLRRSLIEADAEYFSRYVIYHNFNEGVAEFVSIDIALGKLDPDIEAEGARRRNKLLYGKEEEGVLEEYHKAMNLAFEGLDLISLAKDALLEGQLPSREGLSLGLDTMSLISKSGYVVGYYFVAHAMNGLIEKGFDKKDALELLIENPPSNIKELKDPLGHVEKVVN